jgi:hypothetical protein
VHALVDLTNFRILLVDAVTTDASESEVKKKIVDRSADAGKVANQMERLFRVGLLFATIFGIAVWR